MNLPKKYKRGHAFIRTDTGENVWLYLNSSSDENKKLVCNDASFPDTEKASYDWIDLSFLKELFQSRSTSISSKPKKLTAEAKSSKQELNEFFDKVGLTIPFHCENCYKPLYANNKFAKRCVTAHILPKSQFETISMNKDNILFMGVDLLGTCNCHTEWDSSIINRINMPVYKLALERFELLKAFLNQQEYIKACTYLNLKWQ